MSSNDDPGKPDAAGGSGVTANSKDNELRVILSVPNLSRPGVEPVSEVAAEPTDLTSTSELSSDTAVEPTRQESFAKQALSKTASLGQMFTENKRTFGTLGTVAVAIFICTLVARAMKQDHSAAGSLPELAFREPPATNELEAEPVEPAGIVEATPDFDPATLLSSEDAQAAPPQTSTQRQRNSSGPFAPMYFEQDVAQPAARASAGGEFPDVPGDTPDTDMRGTPDHLYNTASNLQTSPSSPPWSYPTTAESRWSEPVHEGYQANLNPPQNSPAMAASSGTAAPGAAAMYEPNRTQEQVPAGGYPYGVQESTTTPPQTIGWPARQLAAQEQDEPRYPSTSTTAYPSFQELQASLQQRRIQREQQPRLGDRREASPPNRWETGVGNEFSGELR